MKILVYVGILIAVVLFRIPYGQIVALSNVFIYCVSLAILMTFLNAKQFKSDWMDDYSGCIWSRTFIIWILLL